jgi:hypothetical protein
MVPKRKKTTTNKASKRARKAKSPTRVPSATPAESEDNGNTSVPDEEGNVEMIDLISDGNSRDGSDSGEGPERDNESDVELGNILFLSITIVWLKLVTERMKKKWRAPIYGFFKPVPEIVYKDDRRCHVFRCLADGCTNVVRRFVDRDSSTSNLIKHSKKCFGDNTVKAAMSAKNAMEVRNKVVGDVMKNGKLTAVFEKKDRQQRHVSYSHRQHSRVETRFVSTHLQRRYD